MRKLAEQLHGNFDQGLAIQDAEVEVPVEPDVVEPSAEPEVVEVEPRMVPTTFGMRSETDPAKLTATITAGELYDFRLVVRRQGTTVRDALTHYVRACLTAGRVLTEEDVQWLMEHGSKT
jgi:hypothetical protein